MLKAALTIFAALLLLVALGGAIVVGARSLPVPVSQIEQQDCLARAKAEHNKNPECPKIETVWQRSLADPIAFYTLWLTLFTLALAIGAAFQSGLIARQIALARDEFIAAHHPSIILREIDLIESRIHYMLANVGTAATLVESWIMVETTPVDAREPRNLRSFGHNTLGHLKFAHGETKDLEIEPGDVGFYIRFPNAKRLSGDTLKAVGEIYFVGALKYKDAAGVHRRSVFRRRWNAELDRFERTGNPDHEYVD